MRLVARKVASGMWIVAVGIVAPVGFAMAQATKAPPGGTGAAASGAPAAAVAPVPRGRRRPSRAAAVRRAGAEALDPRTIPLLLAQGRAALGAEAFKPARDAYMDVLAIDPKNLAVQADLGYVYLKLEDFPPRDQGAGRRHGRAAAGAVHAAQRVGGADPHPQPDAGREVSEGLHGRPRQRGGRDGARRALGTALSQADDQARNLKFFKDCVAFYDQMNAKLEATRPGEKRWGSQWLPAKEADKKFKEYKDHLAEIDKLQREINDAQAKYDTVEANKNRALSIARRQRQQISTAGFDSEMDRISVAAQKIKDKQDAEWKKVERPPFEQAVAIVMPDEAPRARRRPGHRRSRRRGPASRPRPSPPPRTPNVTVTVKPPTPAAPAPRRRGRRQSARAEPRGCRGEATGPALRRRSRWRSPRRR